MKKVLGFDISSKCIGYCQLNIDSNIKFIQMGYIKPIKTLDLIKNIVDTRDQINKIINEIQPDYIVIEDIIKFMQGKSSAQTIVTLTSFNRMVCLAAADYLKSSPNLYSVLSIRHGLKHLNNKIFPKKEEMPDLVSKFLNITFPWELNRKQKPKPENYDKADAVAVALYYSLILTNQLPSKKKKKKKK